MGNHIINNISIFNDDVLNLILQRIKYGSVWKNIRLVSKQIYNLGLKYQESKLIELANPILTLIYMYPNAGWNYVYISKLGILTIDFIRLTYNLIPWTKEVISSAFGITINDVINADPESIYWTAISKNPSIKVSDMLKYDHLPWDYNVASKNTSIKIEDIRNHPDTNWDYSRLSWNKSLTIKDLSTIMDLSDNIKWLYNENLTYEDYIKYNSNINVEFIIKSFLLDEEALQGYIDISDIRDCVSIFKASVTPKIIKNNPDIDWLCMSIIDYSKFTIQDIIDICSVQELSLVHVFNHPNFTMNDFFNYFDIDTCTKRDLYILSKAHWLTFDIVLKYKDSISWNHRALSRNPNVTVDILESSDFSWVRWNYKYLSRYAQLNIIYIIKNNTKDWNVMMIFRNKSLNEHH